MGHTVILGVGRLRPLRRRAPRRRCGSAVDGDHCAPVPEPAAVEVQGAGDRVEARASSGTAVRVHPVGGVVGPVAAAWQRVDRAQPTARRTGAGCARRSRRGRARCRGVLAEALHGRSRPGELRAGRASLALCAVEPASGHIGERPQRWPIAALQLREEHCHVLGAASVAATPGTMRSSRSAPRSSSASRSRAPAPAPRAEADDLVGRPVPGAGELQHGVGAVLPADGADRCEEASAELRPELEPPALGELGSRVLGARPATLGHRRPRAG